MKSKCPMCNNQLIFLNNHGFVTAGCTFCAFECESKDLPRIAAAMEAQEGLATVESQRDMLKRVIIFIKDECDWEPTWNENGGDERIGDVIRDALAKLEEK